jgi:hypothetical protein
MREQEGGQKRGMEIFLEGIRGRRFDSSVELRSLTIRTA